MFLSLFVTNVLLILAKYWRQTQHLWFCVGAVLWVLVNWERWTVSSHWNIVTYRDYITASPSCRRNYITGSSCCHHDYIPISLYYHRDYNTASPCCHRDYITASQYFHRDYMTASPYCHLPWLYYWITMLSPWLYYWKFHPDHASRRQQN